MYVLPLTVCIACIGALFYALWQWAQEPEQIFWAIFAAAAFSGIAFWGLRAWFWKRWHEIPESVRRPRSEDPAKGLEAAGWGSEQKPTASSPDG